MPDARAFLIEAYNDIEREQAKGGTLETMRGWAGKAAEQACVPHRWRLAAHRGPGGAVHQRRDHARGHRADALLPG
jgi:hypothetical protein